MESNRRAVGAPVSEAERKLRVELAACYHLAHLEGWDELIYNHISARVPGPDHHFLINPVGLTFEEVTASNLIKVDLEGNIIGDSAYSVNAAGFTIHSAIHAARPDVGCILHFHTVAGMAISTLQDGLLPVTQTAMLFLDDIAFHDYEGIAFDLDERARLVRDLGDKSILLLRNHGTLVARATIGQAFIGMYLLEKAARAQLQILASGRNLVTPSAHSAKATSEVGRSGRGGEEIGWQAMLRRLDRVDVTYKA